MVAEPNDTVIREHIVQSLAWVRDKKRSELDAEIEAAGGDLRIDSKEGEAVCVLVEDAIELGELVEPSDLTPEELTSISSLTRLFKKRTGDHDTRSGKDAT